MTMTATNTKKSVPTFDVEAFEGVVPKAKGLFAIKKANAWIDEAKNRPIPEKLYDVLWFSNELCILFADSNLGKSVFAVQITNQIAQKQRVLYFDFELSDKQFENRYSVDYTNHYRFPDNFLRAEIDPDGDFEGFNSFEDYLMHSLEDAVIETGAKVLVIDNITYLKDETEKAKFALPLMKHLKGLKGKYGLSILVLAHTPKRDLTRPITQNEVGGSKMIMNFCDSAFAIGASHKDDHIRYVKQIKERNTPKVYGANNVMVYQVVKPDNFLRFEFMGYSTEQEHLKVISEQDRQSNISKAKELSAQGKSQRQISDILGISLGTVNKYLK